MGIISIQKDYIINKYRDMITVLITRLKVYLTKIRSGRILNKIGAGKRVYFENSFEGMAFKYIPGEIGKVSKYYVKLYGQDEYEIDRNSLSILTAVMEGKPIRKKKYDNYCINEGVSWNLGILKAHTTVKAVGT
jgi:hypothetical protein